MKQRQFKAMYLILCLMMCNPQTLYARNVKNGRIPGTAIFVMAEIEQNEKSSAINVQDKHLSIHKDNLQLDMHVPQLTNLSNSEFQNKLNQDLIKQAKIRKKEMLKLAQALQKDFTKDGLTPTPFEYIETFSVIPSLPPYFTIELYRYQYSGGAHGIPELNYLNIDLNKNQILKLQHLFKENIDYIPILNQEIKQEINRRTQQGEYFFKGTDGFQTISDNQPFFINKEGNLVIVFNVYEIAPYASGPIYITISNESLKEYLK